jgi:hypothetical protein
MYLGPGHEMLSLVLMHQQSWTSGVVTGAAAA